MTSVEWASQWQVYRGPVRVIDDTTDVVDGYAIDSMVDGDVPLILIAFEGQQTQWVHPRFVWPERK